MVKTVPKTALAIRTPPGSFIIFHANSKSRTRMTKPIVNPISRKAIPSTVFTDYPRSPQSRSAAAWSTLQPRTRAFVVNAVLAIRQLANLLRLYLHKPNEMKAICCFYTTITNKKTAHVTSPWYQAEMSDQTCDARMIVLGSIELCSACLSILTILGW
jgi:hypothetical protein